MALVGTLSEFRFAQVLNAVRATRKSGRLIVERENQRAELFFDNGRLSQAQISGEEKSLERELAEQKKIEDVILTEIGSTFDSLNDVGLALILVDSGLVGRELIENVVGTRYIQIAKRLFTWEDGKFHFEPAVGPIETIPVQLGLERVIFDGNRLLAEWEALKKEVPDLDTPVRLASPGAVLEKEIMLSKEEWHLITRADGKTTLREIAEANGTDDLDIRRQADRLLKAGLIRLTIEPILELPSAIPQEFEIKETPVEEVKPVARAGFFHRMTGRLRGH